MKQRNVFVAMALLATGVGTAWAVFRADRNSAYEQRTIFCTAVAASFRDLSAHIEEWDLLPADPMRPIVWYCARPRYEELAFMALNAAEKSHHTCATTYTTAYIGYLFRYLHFDPLRFSVQDWLNVPSPTLSCWMNELEDDLPGSFSAKIAAGCRCAHVSGAPETIGERQLLGPTYRESWPRPTAEQGEELVRQILEGRR